MTAPDPHRDQIAAAIAHRMNVTMFKPGTVAWGELERGRPVAPAEPETYLDLADAIMPILAAAIAAERERIAAALELVTPAETGDPYVFGVRDALEEGARIARQEGTP